MLDQYDSQLEAQFATYLQGLLYGGVIRRYWYHPFHLKLADGLRYSPDFLMFDENGLTCFEVKGYHTNMRDSLTRLKMAAHLYPCFKWKLVTKERRAWKEQVIG